MLVGEGQSKVVGISGTRMFGAITDEERGCKKAHSAMCVVNHQMAETRGDAWNQTQNPKP